MTRNSNDVGLLDKNYGEISTSLPPSTIENQRWIESPWRPNPNSEVESALCSADSLFEFTSGGHQHTSQAFQSLEGWPNPLILAPPPPLSSSSSMYHGMELPSSATCSPYGVWNMGYCRGMGEFASSSGLSRESSRDDLASMGASEHIFDFEERFRVDRRKLELMMLQRFDPIRETASDFFNRIGEETGTTVIWPSRLKIGAKSKKDPHIRVGGLEEGVRKAKSAIMEYLDNKTNRVTMKMDVSYTDHSHVIGKGGNTIRRVMAETNCHIHFPDSNRSNPNEKSNQVSIAGEIEGVEKARARVRELTPLVFNFDLPIIPSFQSAPDASDPYLRAIQDQYNIQVMFRQKQKNFHTTTVVVKGCEWEGSRVKEATLLLIEHLCSNSSNIVVVSMTMEVSPQHHSLVLGKGNITLKLIMQRTNTTILFPDASDPNIPSIRKGSVTISGAIHNVYLARQQLVGSLPLVMMFDLPDNIAIDDGLIRKLQEGHDVSISIKPKARQSNKAVIIKAQERNASGIYMTRKELLKLEESLCAVIPETYKMISGGAGGGYSVHDPGFSLPVNHKSTSRVDNTLFKYNNYNIPPPLTPPGSWSGSQLSNILPPRQLSGLTGMTPNHPYLREYAMLVLSNISRLQQQQVQQSQQQQQHTQQQHAHQQNIDSWIKKDEDPTDDSKFLHVAGSYMGSPSLDGSPPLNGTSPRNSSPNHFNGNLTNNLSKLDLNQTGQSNDTVSSGLGTEKHSSSSGSDFTAILGELSDRRAPGFEKKNRQFVSGDLDYDHKKVLATKAMTQRPTSGESRMPTPAWSGLGFSRSMTESLLQDVEGSKPSNDGSEDDREKHQETWSNRFGNTSTFESLNNPILSGDDLPSILVKEGLFKYTDLFLRHEIDLHTFSILTENDLKEIGIQTFGARKRILFISSKVRQFFSKQNW